MARTAIQVLTKAPRTDLFRRLRQPTKPEAYGEPRLNWVGHRQVIVYGPLGKPVHVDAAMKSLLQSLWAAGLPTTFCCQGWPGGNPNHAEHPGGEYDWGYVAFADLGHAIHFLQRTVKAVGPFPVTLRSFGDRGGSVYFHPDHLDAITEAW